MVTFVSLPYSAPFSLPNVSLFQLARASTGFSQTDSVITKLIRMTVETGMLTTTAAITELILFLVYQHNNLHMIPALALAKLYTNTLLATFNSRSLAFTSSSRTDAERSTQYAGNEWRRGQTTKDRVQITTVRETHADDGGVQMVALPNRQGGSANDFDEEDNLSKHTLGLGSGPDSYPYLGSQKDVEAQHS